MASYNGIPAFHVACGTRCDGELMKHRSIEILVYSKNRFSTKLIPVPPDFPDYEVKLNGCQMADISGWIILGK